MINCEIIILCNNYNTLITLSHLLKTHLNCVQQLCQQPASCMAPHLMEFAFYSFIVLIKAERLNHY